MIASITSCLIITAIVPNAAPKEREPTSPINICAGYVLNHRKPIPAPIKAPQTISISPELGR